MTSSFPNLVPFVFLFLFFSFCLIAVAKASSTLMNRRSENLAWYCSLACHTEPLLHYRTFFVKIVGWSFVLFCFIMKGHWIVMFFQHVLNKITTQFLFFSLLLCCLIYWFFSSLPPTLHLRITPIWSWCIIMLTCSWIWFIGILLKKFASMFIREAGEEFCFLSGFCHQKRAGLIEWTGKTFLLLLGLVL